MCEQVVLFICLCSKKIQFWSHSSLAGKGKNIARETDFNTTTKQVQVSIFQLIQPTDEMTISTMTMFASDYLTTESYSLSMTPPLGKMQLQTRPFTVKLSWMTRGSLLEIIGFALEKHLLSVVAVIWGEFSVSSHFPWPVMVFFIFLFVSSGTVMSVRLTTCTLNTLKTPCSLSTSQTSPRTNASPGQSVYLFLFVYFFFSLSV